MMTITELESVSRADVLQPLGQLVGRLVQVVRDASLLGRVDHVVLLAQVAVDDVLREES